MLCFRSLAFKKFDYEFQQSLGFKNLKKMEDNKMKKNERQQNERKWKTTKWKKMKDNREREIENERQLMYHLVNGIHVGIHIDAE